jgi:hypothetical protein
MPWRIKRAHTKRFFDPASGLINTARMIGATLGVAVLGAVFAMHVAQSVYSATMRSCHGSDK